MTAIEFENISKQYRLGLVSTGTLAHDLNRFWQTKVLGREDPYLKIGETNDRSTKGASDYVWALRDIDFKVEEGDVVGIIGRNGAGKSTLLKLLSRVTAPTTGVIRARGRIASLLEVGTGFHPEMTGRENIFMNGSIMGMSHDEIVRKLDEIVDFSGCERYLDTPVKRYSSGMTVRLGFAIAAHLEPEILVVDEVLAVGDAEFQKKAVGKMQDVAQGEGRTVLFVSHNMRSVRSLCKSVVVLEKGHVVYNGDVDGGIGFYTLSNSASQTSASLVNKPRNRKMGTNFRFTNIRLLDGEGNESEPRCGFPMRIELTYSVKVAIKQGGISAGFYDLTGAPIASLNAWLTKETVSFSPGVHYAVLTIPKVPLTAGQYSITVWGGEINGQQDSLEDALRFNVADDDFYGTGRMVNTGLNGKVVLLEHKWDI